MSVRGDHRPDIEVDRHELVEPARYRFALERRAFLRVFGAMGGGLAVVAAMPARGQESGRGGARGSAAADVAAWLHVGADGRVTVCTGKTEIGQNIRTSLAQAVAEELRVPLDTISMVMADTALVPYDAGTFGSQSTPRMAPVLGRAAACARELLIDRAAARWQVPRASLAAQDGLITGGTHTATYGELAAGAELTGVVAADTPLTPRAGWRVRGTTPLKVNGSAFVTGAHRFTADMVRPGMKYGRVVRPEGYAGALEAADDEAARSMAGVKVVRDADFVGVVADDERDARRAAAAIRATWRAAPGQPSSATLYDHLKRHTPGASPGRGSQPITSGDVTAVRVGAARTFRASYRIPYIAHVPMEPRSAVAEWTDGHLTVWCGTQRPFGVRSQLAEAFRLPEDRVRVIVPDTGSAYGGKHTGEHAIEAARLARGAGAPVRLVWSRTEEFSFGYARPAAVIDVSAGIDANGRLQAWEFDTWNAGGAGIRTPYDVAHQRIEFHPSESPLRQGSYRALAATANHYAREMHMDRIAREMNRDPVAFRLDHLSDDRMRAVLEAAADRIGWQDRAAARRVGIACGTEKGSYVATAAEVSPSADGFTVDRIVVAFECGAVVHPDGVRNQVEGAVVQGLGGALFEALEFADGRLTNGTMAKYRVPRFRDVPRIDIVVIDRHDLPSAGAGETPIVCVAPAIGSAVRRLGRVADGLPVTLVT